MEVTDQKELYKITSTWSHLFLTSLERQLANRSIDSEKRLVSEEKRVIDHRID